MADQNEIMASCLGELEPGHLSLRAPIVDDVLQINMFGQDKEFCNLDLDVKADSMTVRRQDGRDLQVQIRPAGFNDEPTTVLGEAVAEITFGRLDGDYWLMDPEDLDIRYMSGFKLFADTLVNHALIKQRRQRESARRFDSPTQAS